MSLIKDLIDGSPNRFINSLVYHPLVTPFLPVTGLHGAAVLLLYQYLRREHLLNSSLVQQTPPIPDAHLPSYDVWIANGGMKRLESTVPNDDADICIICYGEPTDPTRIAPCRHTFCAECIGAWQATKSNKCPQCLTTLWRSESINYSQLEKLVKFVTAVALASIPIHVFAWCSCLDYYSHKVAADLYYWDSFFFVVFSGVVLIVLGFIRAGFEFMEERRRDHGVNWWGDGIDAQAELAWRMSMSVFAIVGTCWLCCVCVGCDIYVGNLDSTGGRLHAVAGSLHSARRQHAG